MLTHFYFIRHGETEWNKLTKIQGHTDIPLNEIGLQQAAQIGKRLSKLPVDAICSSDLSRAIQTAEAIQKYHPAIPVFVYPELRERNYGQWEGKTSEEVASLSKLYSDHREYGIETIEEIQKRGLTLLEQLIQKYPAHHVAVVSHGGFINALLHYFSEGEHGTGKTKLGNTSFNYISHAHDKWIIHTINDTTHLTE